MSQLDLRSALLEWPHDPEQVSVRKIVSAAGAVRIQMRVELGLLQMDVTGRPDGLRPHDRDTVLEHYQDQLRRYEKRNDTALGFALTPKECLELRVEASQFYRRYVALFVLEDYDAVVRDTAHTLAIFDLCKTYAFDADDQAIMEPYRPYVLMMAARSRAYLALRDNEPASALAHVNRGILQIKSHLEDRGQGEMIPNAQEIKVLQQLASEITGKMPESSVLVQKRALREAIAEERFEDAAKLRDAIRSTRRHHD